MIHSIFEFGDTLVREVMRPRIDIVAIPAEATINEALGLIMEHGHSRLPVYEGSVDHIVGVVYIKDLLPAIRQGRLDQPVREVSRPPFFVPETKKVNDLFKELQRRKVSMAIVLDEYGGTAGLVTMEDLLEEIVGEIQDEYDLEEKPIQLIDDRTAVVNARTPIHEVNEALDLQLPSEDVDTIAGLVYTLFGRVPAQGEAVTVDGTELRVEKTLGQRITKVRITRLPPAGGSPHPSLGSSGWPGPAGAAPTPPTPATGSGPPCWPRTGRSTAAATWRTPPPGSPSAPSAWPSRRRWRRDAAGSPPSPWPGRRASPPAGRAGR